jgi:hypothetical protein
MNKVLSQWKGSLKRRNKTRIKSYELGIKNNNMTTLPPMRPLKFPYQIPYQNASDDKTIVYETSPTLKINISDLRIELINFEKELNKKSPFFSIENFVAILSLGLTLCVASFRDVWIFKADYLKLIFWSIFVVLVALFFVGWYKHGQNKKHKITIEIFIKNLINKCK